MIRRLNRQVTAAVQTPGVLLEAAARYRWDLPAIVRRYLIALKRRYFPKEALILGLLDPAASIEMFEKLSSRAEMYRAQERLNPPTWEWVLSDKGMFYRFAAAAGIPVPRLLGQFDRDTAGWSSAGRVLSSEADWSEFLLRECPPDIVTKPVRSSYGEGVRVFHRQGDVLVDGEGRSWSPAGLIASLRADPKPCHIIQERLFNHEDLAVLSGSPGLQTARVMTCITRSGNVRILGAFFRAVVGSNWIDNHAAGKTGNLFVNLDEKTGAMLNATIRTIGITEVARHPDTGRPFAGQRMPLWGEVLALAKRAARAVWPIRTVGWDIAVTPAGPVIVEGNFWYDPPNGAFRMGEVFSAISPEYPPARIAG